MGGINRLKVTTIIGALDMENMKTFYIIKTNEMTITKPQDIKLSSEQLSGCVKLLYAMNRAGFDLSALKIVEEKK